MVPPIDLKAINIKEILRIPFYLEEINTNSFLWKGSKMQNRFSYSFLPLALIVFCFGENNAYGCQADVDCMGTYNKFNKHPYSCFDKGLPGGCCMLSSPSGKTCECKTVSEKICPEPWSGS